QCLRPGGRSVPLVRVSAGLHLRSRRRQVPVGILDGARLATAHGAPGAAAHVGRHPAGCLDRARSDAFARPRHLPARGTVLLSGRGLRGSGLRDFRGPVDGGVDLPRGALRLLRAPGGTPVCDRRYGIAVCGPSPSGVLAGLEPRAPDPGGGRGAVAGSRTNRVARAECDTPPDLQCYFHGGVVFRLAAFPRYPLILITGFVSPGLTNRERGKTPALTERARP